MIAPREAIRALVDASPADAVLSVPRAWLAELLAPDAQEGVARPSGAPLDATVADVAQRFNRKPSTVRTWCERGELPGAYRNRGREWRIPASAIARMQQEQAEQHIARQRAPQPRQRTNGGLGAWRQHVPQPPSND